MTLQSKSVRNGFIVLGLMVTGVAAIAWNSNAGEGCKANASQASSCTATATQASNAGGCCASKTTATQASNGSCTTTQASGGACTASQASAGGCASGAAMTAAGFPMGTTASQVEVPGGMDIIFSSQDLGAVEAMLRAKADACNDHKAAGGDCSARSCSVMRAGNSVVLSVRGENVANCCAAVMGTGVVQASNGACTQGAGASCTTTAGACGSATQASATAKAGCASGAGACPHAAKGVTTKG